MHQATGFQVKAGGVVKHQRSRRVEVVVSQTIGGADRVRLELRGHVDEVWLCRIPPRGQPIAPVEALEQGRRVDPGRAALPTADVAWIEQILPHAAQELGGVGADVLYV